MPAFICTTCGTQFAETPAPPPACPICEEYRQYVAPAGQEWITLDHLRRGDGAKWICSPPMRSVSDNEFLWGALTKGNLQVVGTDHCPFLFDGTQAIEYEGKPFSQPGKELGRENFTLIPNGVPGIGDRMPILWSYGVKTGRISLNRLVELCCTNPAKIFGLYPRKGTLAVGADADIVIWDPEKQVTLGAATQHMNTDYSLYEGMQITGYTDKVLLRGKLIVDGDDWLGQRGSGQFLRRKPHGEVL